MSTTKGLSTDWGLCEPIRLSLHLATPYGKGEAVHTHYTLQAAEHRLYTYVYTEEVVKIEIQDENPFRKCA